VLHAALWAAAPNPALTISTVRAHIAVVIASLAFTHGAYAALCSARSGPQTTAFVELYTSLGCRSCPPADRWLSGLGKRYAPDRVVPLALHVDYADYLGWKEPYARRAFSQRQGRLSMRQRLALVYTPHVLLQGDDFRSWDGSEFEGVVARINAVPARAQIALQLLPSRAGGALHVQVDAQAGESDARLYVAAYESRLETAVALEWKGPFALGHHELTLALLPNAKPADSGVVTFVQKHRTAEVLQALMLPACSP
jgi:hypothetical protein